MGSRVDGAPKTPVYQKTPTSTGIPHPCSGCAYEHKNCNPCGKWESWVKGKWADIRAMFGYKEGEEDGPC